MRVRMWISAVLAVGVLTAADTAKEDAFAKRAARLWSLQPVVEPAVPRRRGSFS